MLRRGRTSRCSRSTTRWRESGHACGHNLICMASVGAAVALHRAIPRLPGTLTVLGTPAEETAGGKVPMVEQGVFDGVDAAMMFHPSKSNWWVRGALAAQGLTITFHGRSSHAAAAPEKGINALNALLLTYHAIDSLRQHVTSDVRIHGIITHGGDAPNVVPALAPGRVPRPREHPGGARRRDGAGQALRRGRGGRDRRARGDEDGRRLRGAQQQPHARGAVRRQHA